MNEQPDRDPGAEHWLGRLLKAAGPRAGIPDSLHTRWSAHFAAELQAAIARRRAARWRIAAAIAAIGVAAMLSFAQREHPPVPAQQVVARIERVLGPVVRIEADGTAASLRKQTALRAGDRISIAAEGKLALDYAGLQLRCDSSTTLQFGAAEVQLLSGRIYIDSGSAPTSALTVNAAGVRVHHVGTQFIVSVFDKHARTSVREGSIRVEARERSLRLDARPGIAPRLELVDGVPGVVVEAPSRNDDWNWIHAIAPAFVLEGKSLDEFLGWATREAGIRLEYSNSAARDHAARTILHGTLPELPPLEALDLVIAGTLLEAHPGTPGVLHVAIAAPH